MMARPFRHEAENRKLAFEIQIDPRLDRSMITDSKRLQQILKNLLSNAFKFTEHGGVRLTISEVAGGWTPDHPALRHAPSVVAFEVSDTGIGIMPEKQKIIFEAFQQADVEHQPQIRRHRPRPRHQPRAVQPAGRRDPAAQHPGPGQHLHALSAAELCRARLRSRERRPRSSGNGSMALAIGRAPELPVEQMPDDRGNIQPGDRTLLIVEDDPHYARIIADLAHDSGLKVLVAHARRGCAEPGARVPAERGLARRVPARHAGLDRPQPAQAGPDDAPHPGADRHARRRPPARAGARRLRVRDQAVQPRRPGGGAVAHRRVHHARGASGC